MRPNVLCFLALLSLPGLALTSRRVQGQDSEPVDPVKIVLLSLDLRDAAPSMVVYDRDENGAIDRDEQKRLKWSAETLKRFDINRDGELAPLEVAPSPCR